MANLEIDLESVRQDYRASLQDLTFNSKPIITNLTIIAQENLPAARAIVQAIEDQIRTCPPPHKLPVLYLLDSISKNVGGIYIQLFARNLCNTFMDTYDVVDQPTKQKLERVLATWKSGPTGSPVYSTEVTGQIERALLKQQLRMQSRGSIDVGRHIHINPNFLSGAIGQNTLATYQQQAQQLQQSQQTQQLQVQPVTQVQPVQQTANQWVDNARYNNGISGYTTAPNRQGYYNTQQYTTKAPAQPLQQSQVFAPPPDQQRLLQECQQLIVQHQQYALQNPADLHNQNQLGSLQQLSEAIQKAPLTSDQIQQVRQFFATQLSVPSAAPTQTSASVNASSFSNLTHSLTGSIPFTVPILNPPVATPVSMPPTSVVPPSVSSHSALVPDPNALVKNLMDFGLLGSGNMVGGVGGTVTPANVGGFVGGSTPTPPPSGSAANDAPTAIMHVNDLEKIQLTSNDIQRKRDGVTAILYDALPLQCKQCGFRYARDEGGKAKMDAHLDWHFRQNRRMKEKAKKAQSRSWFVSEEDWIHSREAEIKSTQSPAFFDFENANAAKGAVGASQPKKDDVVKESTVIVPLDPERAGRPCTICQEKFQVFWNDADEEWLFRNAIEVEGVIYHATCHADALKNQENAQSSGDATTSTVLGKRKPDS
ncbi:43389_t:CDS:2, partial [Gigaspora margarita]